MSKYNPFHIHIFKSNREQEKPLRPLQMSLFASVHCIPIGTKPYRFNCQNDTNISNVFKISTLNATHRYSFNENIEIV